MESNRGPRHSRTRTGCLTCRSRKKKCDEVRPRCAGCRRNLLDCKWPAYIAWNGGSQTDAIHPRPKDDARYDHQAQGQASPSPGPYPNIYTGEDRACALTPHSILLLGHFARETVSFFAMTPLRSNPLLMLLMPLGCIDDLLMHSLLALGGAHLAHKNPTNMLLADSTRLHYANLIRGLRVEIARLDDNDLECKERLLSVLGITCLYEIVSGDTQGATFKHLHACRRLILSLLGDGSTKSASSIINSERLSFSIELYRYLVFSNTLTPYGITSERSLPLDPFLTNIEEPQMRGPLSFEPIFAGTCGLFRLVPLISVIASQRLNEESRGLDSPSPSLVRMSDDLYDRIQSWRLDPRYQEGDADRREQISRVAEMIRLGLYIYLRSALAGSVISDAADLCAIQEYISQLYSYAHVVLPSQYTVILLWPVVIAGSCTLIPDEQNVLLREIYSMKYGMKHMAIVGDVLQLLWDDPDPRAYGPYGLHFIMQKHALSVGLA
uniref:Zn(2)-C6 fungal-type domain-containing protein n=2 Tax=Bionectria ochroleuca TaxID=29856 RepID=A0A0B7KCT4_BIOOC